MASVKHMLENTLMDLENADLKRFQQRLEDDHKCISKSEMENADMIKTVNKMVACFGQEEAVKIMVGILRKINQNELAEQLENEHKQAQTKGITNTSVPVGADTDQTSIKGPILSKLKFPGCDFCKNVMFRKHSHCLQSPPRAPPPSHPPFAKPPDNITSMPLLRNSNTETCQENAVQLMDVRKLHHCTDF
ncbi:LRR and PYD domains-containing 3-like protein [Labeo rohita]|uniref:LRR and PYD domains-containing 3-like protein n=1 Tax=Labeo rohita TaxID=84645 RepID=A0A498ML25_LABRO|nr:LRR and PYD domains-containing 3-like protein [Labeo rohita]